MTSPTLYLTQGIRIYRNRLNLKANGFHEYDGNARDICTQIIEDCWNGCFFQTSTTHFPQFWTRDFGWCMEALIKLGYARETEKTLLYALDCFSEHDKVTTTITPRGRPFDFPRCAVDSLPWLVRSISLAKNKEMFEPFFPFLEKEVKKFCKKVIDLRTGLVKPLHFSSIKDFAVRKSSCYDNCTVGVLSKALSSLGMRNPLERFDYEMLLLKHFWNGEYFYDDFHKQKYIAADANIFPFYLGIVNDEGMLRSAVDAIHREGLDYPFPVKYTTRHAPVQFIWQEFLMKGYEGDSIWTHMGPLYISLVRNVDKKQAWSHLQSYTTFIERYKNYPEVFDSKGKPFQSVIYHCDQGMLWAANCLALL